MDVKWLFDIIDSKIWSCEEQAREGLYTLETSTDKIDTLKELKSTIEEFIKEANKL